MVLGESRVFVCVFPLQAGSWSIVPVGHRPTTMVTEVASNHGKKLSGLLLSLLQVGYSFFCSRSFQRADCLVHVCSIPTNQIQSVTMWHDSSNSAKLSLGGAILAATPANYIMVYQDTSEPRLLVATSC
jgi:hypothetical protein